MAERLLEKISNADHQIVVVDAPALVEAGWDKYVHEVWTSMIPGDEAVKRTMERDNLTEELVGPLIRFIDEAKMRLGQRQSEFPTIKLGENSVINCYILFFMGVQGNGKTS